MLASIIVLNYNGLEHLGTCLESIERQTCQDFELILVDNGSDDGSADFVRTNYPWVKLVELDTNTGFATGNNVGLNHSNGRYIVTLNNDTRVEPTWLEELIVAARRDDSIGMVASRICVFNDPEVIDSIGVRMTIDGMSRGSQRFARYQDVALDEYEEILMPSACAALYNRDMIREIGFFDDDFFAYCEDTDLGFRGRLYGWKAILAKNAIVYHKYSQTGGSLSPFKVYLVERNHFWVCVKNMPASRLGSLPFVTLVRYLYQIRVLMTPGHLSGEYSRAKSKTALLLALMRGMVHAVSGTPRMLAKRRRIMAGRKLENADTFALLNRYKLTYRELFDRAG